MSAQMSAPIPARLRLPLLLGLSAVSTVFLPAPALGAGTSSGDATDSIPLESRIQALDDAVFDAFNRCADPEQLERHASYFAEDVEFYHDTGGVTWNRAAMLDNTRRHACGHYTRERVPDTLKVFPIRDFGAIEQGVHRFCRTDGACEGEADFVIVWRRTADGWRITRVLSYGHRPAS